MENNGILGAFMVPHPPMIVPEVGRGSEKSVEETTDSYMKVAEKIAALKPETIIITSPHSIMYADYFHISPGTGAKGSFASFEDPSVRLDVEYDTELSAKLCELADKDDFPAGVLGEKDKNLDHGTMVPLWFILKKYTDFRLIRIGLSGLPLADHYRFGTMIKDAVNSLGRKAVLVASGDLSHKLKESGPYGFAKEGPEYDERIMDVCSKAEFGRLFDFDENFCRKAAECGHRSFVIMAGALDGLGVEAKRLSHQDVTGVGYGICTFKPLGVDENRHFLDEYLKKIKSEIDAKKESCDGYVRLARQSLESYVLYHKTIPVPDDIAEEMKTTRAGAFVSIHKFGELRGCIGTTEPTTPSVAKEIINNAISAAVNDPRFDAIRPDELKWLDINVDVLSPAEDISSKAELDVKKYGVIVSCGRRRGLLLPDLEGVDTVDDQISIALKKGGIRPDEDYHMQRFEAVRHI